MLLSQNAALGTHTLILDDGPELPKTPGPHVEEEGEILEGVCAQGFSSLHDSMVYV
jgi:hypothetical protein